MEIVKSVNDFHALAECNGQNQGNSWPSLAGKTSSVSMIFTHRTHRNVKTCQVRSFLNCSSELGVADRVGN